MELRAAERLARELMSQHGLAGWSFAWDRARRRFGTCSVERRRITLSAYLTHLNDEAHVRDTILHEIAHALAPGDGHGARWKAACRRIGATPERCYREAADPRVTLAATDAGRSQTAVGAVVAPKTGLRVGCATCNWWVGRHRITWAVQQCRKCGTTVTWEHVRTGRRYHIAQVPGGFRAMEVPSAVAASPPTDGHGAGGADGG